MVRPKCRHLELERTSTGDFYGRSPATNGQAGLSEKLSGLALALPGDPHQHFHFGPLRAMYLTYSISFRHNGTH